MRTRQIAAAAGVNARQGQRHPGAISRRRLIAGGGALAGLALMARFATDGVDAAARFTDDPFSLGVASGDPLPDGVVLWTRLAPAPLDGGGMPPVPVPVEWRVAADESMRQTVQQGTVVALPELAHSVHIEVEGLEPDRWYWYQFHAGAASSVVGRTHTAPAAGSQPDRLRFAFASCQNWEQGYFTAYRHMADEDLDLVVHLGDYIYEGAAQRNRPRSHQSNEPVSLDEYRARYALYKTDPDLQAAHAAFPWIVTWDDHELANNYAAAADASGWDPAEFLKRRAAAYQAYWEHLPLRRSSMPVGPDMTLYRRLDFGDLARFNVLDTRQYRTDQPCGDGLRPRCIEAFDPTATLTGPAQERWLVDSLAASPARWNVIAQQVMMADVDRRAGADETFFMDQWAAYPAARDRLLAFLEASQTSNPIVISGDIHSNWTADLTRDFRDPRAPVIATEFVGTSISSGGNGNDITDTFRRILAENPHVRFYNNQRGFVRCELTPERWLTEYRVVPYVSTAGAPISTRAAFVVEDGHAGTIRIDAE
ncbi:MAG: alkaline phosphatase [Dehalococcoidia bacterium]